MAGKLIRSGKLADYQACGDDGRPVYRAADQIREAIRLQMNEEAASHLAIPKLNDDGDAIDWYAPNDGYVVPWSSATTEEREQAKESLTEMRSSLTELSEKMLTSEDSERRTFGLLLQNTVTFPSEDYVYLVNGKPVVAFWGFRDPTALETDSISLLTIPPRGPVETPVVPPPVVEKRRGFPWWLWPLLLLLLLLLAFLLWWFFFRAKPITTGPINPAPVEVTDDRTDEDLTVEEDLLEEDVRRIYERGGRRYYDFDGDGRLEPVPPGTDIPGAETVKIPESEELPLPEQMPPEPELPENTPPLPEDLPTEPPVEPPVNEDQPPLPEDQSEQPPVDPQDQTPPTPPEPMTIPPDALQNGDPSFLNGDWKAVTGLQDSQGRPVDVEYSFENGEGTVQITDADGQVCSGSVGASVGSGSVSLNGQSVVNCPNGDQYRPANVECAVGADGQADCSGSYEGGDSFGVMMERGGAN